jgi:hypothetical protein
MLDSLDAIPLSRKGKKNPMNPKNSQKGFGKIFYILIGALLAIAILFTLKHFHDKNNGLTIQLPKVEVH